MNSKQKTHLTESLKSLENNIFDERDVRLLLIEIRDLLSGESFLREVADFVAHPARERGLCHSTINSRYGKMKFMDEGQQRLHNNGIFSNNPDKPFSFFSDQILSYIQTPQIKKELFEIIIKEGIEEIPNSLFLKFYNINKDKVRNIVFSSYVKSNGYYHLKPEVEGREYLLLDDLLKFIRGTLTGISAFTDKDLKKDLTSCIERISIEQNIGVDFVRIIDRLDGVVVCIISILHEATFKMFDGTLATAYLTINRADPLKDDQTQFLTLYVQTPNYSFPVITTDISATLYIEATNEYLRRYEGLPMPWNYVKRNEDNALCLLKVVT